MIKKLTGLTAGALALGLCAPDAAAQNNGEPAPATKPTPIVAAPQDTPAAGTHHLLAPARASKLIGTRIVDAGGETLWEIEELVVSPSGAVFALVLGEDARMSGIPLASLEAHLVETAAPEAEADDRPVLNARTARVDRFSLIGKRALFDSAPTCKDARSVDPAWLTRTASHYAAGRDAPRDPVAPTPERAADGKTTVVARRPTFIQEFLGQDVVAKNGDTIGSIKDVAIDVRSGRVAYAIVSAGGVLGLGATLHAVAFDVLALPDGSINASMTEAGLAKLPVLDMDRLTSTAVASASTPRSTSAAGSPTRLDR